MTNPLIVLAACALLVGLVFGPSGIFEAHLLRTPGFRDLGHAEHGYDWLSAIVGTLVGLGGLALSWRMYAQPSDLPSLLARRLGPLYRASMNKFAVDEMYSATVIAGTWLLAAISTYFDLFLDTLLVGGAAWLPRYTGRRFFAPYQNGLIQFYAAATALGVAVLLCVLLLI
jgi:NADH-quinone oxidoreductase subunit L